tara:strand:+ start:2881 stop:4314 length:1434 start_codon:yes stop_codon:yes gene_type:complete
MAESSSAQEFEFKYCKIYPNAGGDPIVVGLDLIQYFVYSENVTSPFVAARMNIVDGGGLLNSVPVQGMERVEIALSTVIESEPVIYNFKIFSVQGRYAQQNLQNYTIALISEEALVNEATRLNAPILGKGDSIVSKLLGPEIINSPKKVYSETTMFETKLLPCRRRPFDIINSIATRSISSKATFTKVKTGENDDGSEITENKIKGSAGFYFWENRRGYNFFSLDALADVEGSTFAAPNLQSESWGPYKEQLGNDEIADTQFAVLFSMFGSDMNILESLRKGKYASKVAIFNYSTGFYEEVSYTLKDAYNNMAHLGAQEKQNALPALQTNLAENYSRIITSFVDHETFFNEGTVASPEDQDGSKNPTKYADWVKYFAAQSNTRYELMKQQQCTVVIPGNSLICAGDKVEIHLKNKQPNAYSETEPYDPESSGVYLVYEVVHNYSLLPPSSGNGSFTTTLNLVRDSYGVHGEESKHNI